MSQQAALMLDRTANARYRMQRDVIPGLVGISHGGHWLHLAPNAVQAHQAHVIYISRKGRVKCRANMNDILIS